LLLGVSIAIFGALLVLWGPRIDRNDERWARRRLPDRSMNVPVMPARLGGVLLVILGLSLATWALVAK
jgi:hypothetical protein